MTLHLPPPSEPPERPERFVGRQRDQCMHCFHEWHGLDCRVGPCACLSSYILDQRSKANDER